MKRNYCFNTNKHLFAHKKREKREKLQQFTRPICVHWPRLQNIIHIHYIHIHFIFTHYRYTIQLLHVFSVAFISSSSDVCC